MDELEIDSDDDLMADSDGSTDIQLGTETVDDDLAVDSSTVDGLMVDSNHCFPDWYDNDHDQKFPPDRDLSGPADICSTSMDYEEESIHPGEYHHQVQNIFVIYIS
jgi:hypothetical protein